METVLRKNLSKRICCWRYWLRYDIEIANGFYNKPPSLKEFKVRLKEKYNV